MREFRWVGALLWRCLSYALLLAVYFFGLGIMVAMLFVVVWGLTGFVGVLMASWHWPWFSKATIAAWGPIGVTVLMLVTLEATVIGFMGGAFAGFYSPPRDLGSVYQETVIKNGSLGLGVGASAGMSYGFILAITVGGALPCLDIVLVLAFVGQSYGLWRGINAGLGEVKSGDKVG